MTVSSRKGPGAEVGSWVKSSYETLLKIHPENISLQLQIPMFLSSVFPHRLLFIKCNELCKALSRQ